MHRGMHRSSRGSGPRCRVRPRSRRSGWRSDRRRRRLTVRCLTPRSHRRRHLHTQRRRGRAPTATTATLGRDDERTCDFPSVFVSPGPPGPSLGTLVLPSDLGATTPRSRVVRCGPNPGEVVVRQLLSDITVVELSREPAGAYCAKLFADLGATVVKVEPLDGDPVRGQPAKFFHLNTNKRSIVVDEDAAGAADQIAELAAHADVLVQSLGVGDLAAYGLTVDEVRQRFPQLVVTSISGFGATGPYSGYRWNDLTAQTSAWFTYPQGAAFEVPLKLPGVAGLCALGNSAALGGLAGVVRARTSGVGAHVDCAAYEALSCVPSRS